jgi:uncharacterized protein YjbJ (UPF0337 family)
MHRNGHTVISVGGGELCCRDFARFARNYLIPRGALKANLYSRSAGIAVLWNCGIHSKQSPPGGAMNWDQVEGKWKQVKGEVKVKWGKLTDDDLDVINGKRQQLVGKLQERYGTAKEVAEKQADEFAKSLKEAVAEGKKARRAARG